MNTSLETSLAHPGRELQSHCSVVGPWWPRCDKLSHGCHPPTMPILRSRVSGSQNPLVCGKKKKKICFQGRDWGFFSITSTGLSHGGRGPISTPPPPHFLATVSHTQPQTGPLSGMLVE